MIEWIFMALDLISVGALSLSHFGLGFPFTLLWMSALYLIAKGIIFRDFMSFVDLACGVYILMVALFHFQTFLYYFVLGWFIYKLASTVSY